MPQNENEQQKMEIDAVAFTELFNMHEAALFRYVRYLAGSSHKAEDIYQETWLRVARQLSRGKQIRNFKSFLFTVATNIYKDELKRLQIRRFFLGPSADDEQMNETIWAATENVMDENALSQTLENGLDRLSTKQRTTFCLSYIEGFKISEISRMMNCAQGTVKATLHKAVQKLRRELKDYRKD